MADRIQVRRGTAPEWSAVDPVLADGEVGYDRTNNQLRIGNSATPWSALTPISAVTLSGVATLVDGDVPLIQLGNAQRAFLFDLRDYSAVGDGSTNDTTAFQAAIDAANTAGGGIVLGQPGKTYFCSNLQAKSNVVIDLQGATLKRRTVNTTQVTVAVGVSNVEIRNVIFDGQRSIETGSPTINGAVTVQGSYVLVHRCVFNDLSGSAVVGSSGTYVTLRDSIVNAFGDHVAYASTTAHDWLVDNVISSGPSGDGAYKVRNGASRFTVRNCYHSGDRLFVASAETNGCSQIRIENCVADVEFNPVIFSATLDNVVITDTHIVGCSFTNTQVGGYANIDFGFATTPAAATLVRIDKCVFTGFQGLNVVGSSTVPVVDVVVTQCVFNNVVAAVPELLFAECRNICIERCYFSGNGHSRAIDIGAANNLRIQHNTWTGNVTSVINLTANGLSTGNVWFRYNIATATSRFVTSGTPSGAPTGKLILESNTITQSSTDNPNAGFLVQYATPYTRNATTSTGYTLVGIDAGKFLERSNASANTITVPPNSSVPFPIGTQITIVQTGAGQTTITPGVGVTINATPGLKLSAQWAAATIVKRATDTWVAYGSLAA